MQRRVLWAMLFAALSLAGCANTWKSVKDKTTGLFSDEKPDETTLPTPLKKDFASKIKIKALWSERAGKGSEELYLKLLPAPYEDAIFTADREGHVLALAANNGDEVWSAHDKNRRISGGPGVGAGKVFVGTSEADVVARDAKTGKKLWVARVSSEVLAQPRVAGNTVIVRTGDGNVYALDVDTGREKWVYDRTIPTLTLRGTAPPAIADGLVVAGFDSGRLVALDINDGKQVWETQLAQPSGRSDLERLVDLDGEPVIRDDTVYIGSFQGRVAAVSLRNGAIEWTRDMSTYDDVAVDDKRVYITDERGVIWALDRFDGSAKWRQRDFRYRRLTGPAHFEHYVVVGDFEGYLHWLDDETGEVVARERIDKERILTPPIDLGEALLGYSSSGKLVAYHVQ